MTTNMQTKLIRCATRAAVILVMIATSVSWTVRAQPFNSGSDGSYGPMNITSNTTLNIPANGIFNCTTINVASGVTLTFNKNPLNTPVYLLATSNVTISGGTIDLRGGGSSGGNPGIGGPGGFDGGFGGFGIGANTQGGDGQGPGAGKISLGGGSPYFGAAHAQSTTSNTNTYGNALISPLVGGSGGSGNSGNPGDGGGGGGGAILIAANTSVTINGLINCSGGLGTGGGSGGAIRIVSPLVTGSGALYAIGGGSGVSFGSGSLGRIRIDCQDAYAFRSLTMYGVATRGAQMFVFPAVIPRLDIVAAAGLTIPEGTNSGVVINLPAGSTNNHSVTVQARNFTNDVPITVSVVPENRLSSNYLATIIMTNNPSQITVPVVIPDGTITRIHAWTSR